MNIHVLLVILLFLSCLFPFIYMPIMVYVYNKGIDDIITALISSGIFCLYFSFFAISYILYEAHNVWLASAGHPKSNIWNDRLNPVYILWIAMHLIFIPTTLLTTRNIDNAFVCMIVAFSINVVYLLLLGGIELGTQYICKKYKETIQEKLKSFYSNDPISDGTIAKINMVMFSAIAYSIIVTVVSFFYLYFELGRYCFMTTSCVVTALIIFIGFLILLFSTSRDAIQPHSHVIVLYTCLISTNILVFFKLGIELHLLYLTLGYVGYILFLYCIYKVVRCFYVVEQR